MSATFFRKLHSVPLECGYVVFQSEVFLIPLGFSIHRMFVSDIMDGIFLVFWRGAFEGLGVCSFVDR